MKEIHLFGFLEFTLKHLSPTSDMGIRAREKPPHMKGQQELGIFRIFKDKISCVDIDYKTKCVDTWLHKF